MKIKKLAYDHLYWNQSPNSTEGLYLSKPIPPDELKRTYPNVKGLEIEFNKGAFGPTKIDQDSYLRELLDIFDLEELIIKPNRLTQFPDNIWKPSLKSLSIEKLGGLNDSVKLDYSNLCKIENLSIDLKWIRPDERIFNGTIKMAFLENCGNATFLNHCINIEHIQLYADSSRIGVDFRNFPYLKHLNYSGTRYNRGVEIEDRIDLSLNHHLQEVYLAGLKHIPLGLGNSKELKRCHLYKLGSPESPGKFFFQKLEYLNHLDIQNCHFDYTSNSFLGALPNLKHLSIYAPKEYSVKLDLKKLNTPFLQSALGNISFEPGGQNSQFKSYSFNAHRNEHFINLTDKMIEGLNNFKEVQLNQVSNESLNSLSWNRCTHLERIDLNLMPSLRSLPEFNSAHQNLNRVALSDLPLLTQLPNSWQTCPNLNAIMIRNCSEFCLNDWQSFPQLEELSIYGKVKQLSGKLFLWQSLKRIHIDESNVRPEFKTYTKDIINIITSQELSQECKLLFGDILFDNLKNPVGTSAFLEIFNSSSTKFKRLAWEKLHLINPFDFYIDKELLSKNSIAILGRLNSPKTYFKEKLQALGADYHNKPNADTKIIVVGEKFELPESFFEYAHYYISETQLSELVKDIDPGFVQVLESDGLRNLRELLWSNEIENERIVLEMIKGGGLPDELIPDLVLVAKTSKDASVKNGLKKLLKSRVSAGVQNILSDKINLRNSSFKDPYRLYKSYDPDFDVSQLALTFAKRENSSFVDFFRSNKSLQNQYRSEIFESVYPQFLKRPHYIDMRWQFTSSEINLILNRPEIQGKLKRLILAEIDSEEIIKSLLLHKNTLQQLSFHTKERCFSAEISKLKKLKQLIVHADNMEGIPKSFIELKKLKELYIYSQNQLVIDYSLKELTEIERFISSKGYIFS